MNGSVYVGQKALSLTEYEKTAPISGVILWVDDENCYEAGDETGTVIEQDCPYASQNMANNLLATLQGYSYQGLEANGAKVSPVAELGDGLTVGGLYTQLAYQNIRFSTGEVMDVAAPGSDETLHEYKTDGQTTKQFTHQIAETRSLISKTSEEILLQVENEVNGLSASVDVKLGQIQSSLEDEINGLSSSVTLQLGQLKVDLEDEINGLSASIDLQIDGLTTTIQGQEGQISSITQTVGSIQTQISGIDGEISSLEQYVDSITLSVINGSESSTIQLKAGSTTISSANITFNGMVTFNDLSTAGSTVINGANITTGTISADRINLTGAITWNDLEDSVQNDINDAVSTANDAYDMAYDNQLPSYIKNTYIDSARIESPTIYAGEFYGNEFNVYSEGEDGSFNLYAPVSGSYHHMLEISYFWSTGAFVSFDSPAGADATIDFSWTRFRGDWVAFENGVNVDFSNANVTGLYLVFD